jgi:putative PIN family toxin of toxin-antitoxin system
MKVVLDTNLFVASYWNKKSSSRKIFDLARKNAFDVIWSKETREEAEFILKKIKVGEDFLELVGSVFKNEKEVFPKEKISLVKDYADNRLLEASKAGNAGYLVTADRGLLDLKIFENTKIVKPHEFSSSNNF